MMNSEPTQIQPMKAQARKPHLFNPDGFMSQEPGRPRLVDETLYAQMYVFNPPDPNSLKELLLFH